MKYAIYFTWKNNGQRDSVIENTAKKRDEDIKDLIERGEFTEIAYARIYTNGEYGKRIRL